MSNFDRDKNVTTGPFATREQARENARAFCGVGGKVTWGGELEDGWYWKGSIRVEDTNTSITGNFGCGRCARTGRFITMVENGKPKGPGGACFRCGGKGYHSRSDRKRNTGYDKHSFGGYR